MKQAWKGFNESCEAVQYLLRGPIVIGTHDGPKNPYVTLFLLTILGPHC